MEEVVIVSCYDKEALYALMRICFSGLENKFSVNVSHTSRIVIDQDDWKAIPDEQKESITLSCEMFIEGWNSCLEYYQGGYRG
jgi:hypothetical protein